MKARILRLAAAVVIPFMAGCVTPRQVVDVVDVLVPAPVTNTPAVSVEKPVESAPATNALPFDRARCVFHEIARDVLEWKETRTFAVTSLSRDKLRSTLSGSEWPAFTLNSDTKLQGCFCLAVELEDGSVHVGTWDWDKAAHQPVKGLDNLAKGIGAPFQLQPGRKCWWFMTARSRDGKITVRERSNLVRADWP